MSLFEFKFELKNIEDVMPWGDEDNLKLNWFGLTDGYFYLNVGDKKLFHLTDEILEHWINIYPDSECNSNYVDYQVVRPYEDLMEIIPNILQPIPVELFKLIETKEKQIKFEDDMNQYLDKLDDDEDICDEFFDSLRWLGARHLSTMHLNQGPDIWFLNIEGKIVIRWINDGKTEDNIPLWSSGSGEVVIDEDQFLNEVNIFHEELMSEMGKRIDILTNENPIPEIFIDMENLISEHESRKETLKITLKNKPEITDWENVNNAINYIYEA